MRPVLFLLLSMGLLWIGVLFGSWIRSRRGKAQDDEAKLINVLEGAMLTLFGLLIGFTFSMAVSRYDQRKLLVVKEANAIGTTWLRTAPLGEPTRSKEQGLLRDYVQARIQYLAAGTDPRLLDECLRRTGDLQAAMWAEGANYASDHRDVISSIFLTTLNESIDTAEERVAAEENRIPVEAWWLLLFVGVTSMILVGLDVSPQSRVLQLALPLVLAGALGLTMDMESPRRGLIKIGQESFDRLAHQVDTTLPQESR